MGEGGTAGDTDTVQGMWDLRRDLRELDGTSAAAISWRSHKTDVEDYTPWSYEPLNTEQLRWYWNKRPFSLKGWDYKL